MEKRKDKDENERQYRVIDQMLTMHSSLRDRMESRAFYLNTALLAFSLFLTVFSFVGDGALRALGLEPGMTRFILGIAAVFVLLFSITEFRVDWRSVAGRHSEAASRLAKMKARYRKLFAGTGGDDPKENAILTSEYENLMENLPSIPEKWFNTLKAEHQVKKLLSERISHCPKTPILFLRIQLWFEGIREALHCERRDTDG